MVATMCACCSAWAWFTGHMEAWVTTPAPCELHGGFVRQPPTFGRLLLLLCFSFFCLKPLYFLLCHRDVDLSIGGKHFASHDELRR